MKIFQTLIALCLVLCCINAKGQHSELPIYFEEALGNSDTIILGYDISASKGMDSALGEINILGTPYSKSFEVRASMYDYQKIRNEDPRISESKKMIIESTCFEPPLYDEENSIMVLIKSDNWPIKITWDNTLFQDSCRAMAIVECSPGGWFDVCGGNNSFEVIEMKHKSMVTLHRTEYTITTDADTLFALFFPLSRKINVGVEKPSILDNVITFPNPASHSIIINQGELSDMTYQLIDLQGRIIQSMPLPLAHHHVVWDISEVASGIYILAMMQGTTLIGTRQVEVVK